MYGCVNGAQVGYIGGGGWIMEWMGGVGGWLDLCDQTGCLGE